MTTLDQSFQMFQSAHICTLLNSAFGPSTPSSILYYSITLILNTHLPEELQSELAKCINNLNIIFKTH
ncbi:hypothetical protein VNO80_25581 [Phaseolus coccineus]|uniref:Uncharacterized protein n=1 Tax=Phaseolus coccineus TaxID=3886 RepID=A0AAN9LUH0_PHACN